MVKLNLKNQPPISKIVNLAYTPIGNNVIKFCIFTNKNVVIESEVSYLEITFQR